MDLLCTGSFEIGLLGSSLIFGCFIASFILPRSADLYGRRPVFILGLVTQIVVNIAAIYCKKIKMMYALCFIAGFSQIAIDIVAYVYTVEIMPSKVQNNTGLYIFLVFGLAQSYIALQFWFLTKDWKVNAYFSIALCSVSLFATCFWLPESPRFLYG